MNKQTTGQEEKSACCGAEFKIGHGDKEGTHCLVCTNCGDPCEAALQNTQEEKLSSIITTAMRVASKGSSYDLPEAREEAIQEIRNLLQAHDEELIREIEKLHELCKQDNKDTHDPCDPENPDCMREEGRLSGIWQCLDLIRNKHK